jgi:hypothetical protein
MWAWFSAVVGLTVALPAGMWLGLRLVPPRRGHLARMGWA